ncbi:MAG: glycoside hydrolase family 1 protein, partial [Candidatus Eremiobacteraeota bacterium]|nr:glycoside hydrolase family 1 protein [Candidatus Eremiobacteraeota bacterium]
APRGLERADWSWTDERLDRLARLHIEPIVTLLHHGSGPRYTSLLDPEFPEKLAEFARAVARRYPWLRYFTPVNEPLTTARFSALYGHWYPHARSDRDFVTALLNQVAGIARAMKAIRDEIPGARLIQTEDLGKTKGTRQLRYQTEFENERRWMSLDLLCGRFESNRAVRPWFERLGLSLESLRLDDYRCEPFILGFNYYATSERFLDHRVERYPESSRGGNGRDAYVDIETVRSPTARMDGAYRLLEEAWKRYARPLAITEAHLGCSREEQLRWLEDFYSDATRLRSDGVDLRALTVWSALGAYEWNSLLTRRENHYEPGCFDCRDSPPRATLLAAWTRARAAQQSFDHPVLDGVGWWRRSTKKSLAAGARLIVICGDSVTAGHCEAVCGVRGLAATRIRRSLPLAQLTARIRDERPWLVIDADSGWGSSPARAAAGSRVALLVLSVASEGHFTDAERAAFLATGSPLVVRYESCSDARSWIDAALDAAIDGLTGFQGELRSAAGAAARFSKPALGVR